MGSDFRFLILVFAAIRCTVLYQLFSSILLTHYSLIEIFTSEDAVSLYNLKKKTIADNKRKVR